MIIIMIGKYKLKYTSLEDNTKGSWVFLSYDAEHFRPRPVRISCIQKFQLNFIFVRTYFHLHQQKPFFW